MNIYIYEHVRVSLCVMYIRKNCCMYVMSAYDTLPHITHACVCMCVFVCVIIISNKNTHTLTHSLCACVVTYYATH